MGWSGETATGTWQKVDIELSEEDLSRLMLEKGFDEKLPARLPVKICYQLLQNEAEVLLLSKLKTIGYPQDQATARQAVLVGSTQQIVEAIQNQITASEHLVPA